MTTVITNVLVIYDEARQIYVNVYEAPGIGGQRVRAQVPREIQEPTRVMRELLNAGAAIRPTADRDAVTTAIRSKAPIVRRRAQVGWLPRGVAFVSHLHIARFPTHKGRYQPPLDTSVVSAGLRRHGTLDGWKQLIAVARHSTAMTVCLAATFAAPLLFLLNRPSFGLVVVAPSRMGKTSAQIVGASAQGFGSANDLPTLNASAPGLLALAIGSNDHALFIDEIGSARGSRRNVYQAVRDATYALMSGRDVIRHPSWQGGSSAGANTFRVIPVMSSEHSPDTWAARSGETRDEGETARLISLPLAGFGTSIFDEPPTDVAEADLSRWASEQLKALHEGLPLQRGVAFAEYLDALTREPRRARSRARELVEYFREEIGEAAASAVAADIAVKFGILYAGAVIAADKEILPFSEAVIFEAIRKACVAAIEALPDPQARLKQDISILTEKLASGAILDAARPNRRTMNDLRQAEGFWRRLDEGAEYVIRAQAFTAWFATPDQARAVLDYLAEEGFLRLARPPSQGRSNAWAQHQTSWPDGTRPRSITIFLPRGLEDLSV